MYTYSLFYCRTTSFLFFDFPYIKPITAPSGIGGQSNIAATNVSKEWSAVSGYLVEFILIINIDNT